MVAKREWYSRLVDPVFSGLVLPQLTFEEAEKALRKILRAERVRGIDWKKDLVVPTSGNRYSWARREGFGNAPPYRARLRWSLNPDRGWSDFLHDIGHWIWQQRRGRKTPHCREHALLEARLRKMAVRRGWLEGSLRSPDRPAPEPEPEPTRQERRDSDIAARSQPWRAPTKPRSTDS